MSNVQEVFGQFAVDINGTVELFETAVEAQTAYDANANAAGFLAMATAYTTSKGLVEKNAKGKINIIVDFLAFAESYKEGEAALEAADPAADAGDEAPAVEF